MRPATLAGIDRYLPPSARFRVTRRSSLSAFAACSALVMLFCFYGRPAAVLAGAPKPIADDGSVTATIAAQSLSLTREYGFLVVTGEARNVSRKDLPQLEAIVELFDENGRLVNVETGLVKMGSIQAGDEAPFEVQAKDDPDISSYRIRFRKVAGAMVPSRTEG